MTWARPSALPPRDLLWQIMRRDLRSRNRRTILGVFWVILGPLLATTVIVISLSGIFAGTLGGLSEYAVYTLSGVVFVQFTSFGLSGVSNAISAARGIISKVATPPLLFPLASVLSACITWSITSIYVVTANVVVAGEAPSPMLFLAMGSYALFLLGCGLLISVVNVHYEDATSILPIVVQGLTFLTPVFYSSDIWSPLVASVLEKNPLYWYLQMYRSGVGVGPSPDLMVVGVAVAAALGAAVFGIALHLRMWPRLVRSL